MSDYFAKKGIFINSEYVSLITITSLNISNDLKHAKVYITTIDNQDNNVDLVNHLNKNANIFKFFIGKKIRTKNIPNLKFFYDNLFFGNVDVKE